jgi:hypothetical protein
MDSNRTNGTRRHRKLVVTRWGVALYFGLLLLPKWVPAASGTVFFFIYLCSIPMALLVLLGLGGWGAIVLLKARVRGTHPMRRHRGFVLLTGVGIASCVLALGLFRILPCPLPSGSHLLTFDATVWQDPASSQFVAGDITPRQKMLADVVKHVLPGRTGVQLEEVLGPSLETPYFASTGRDLIYVLGPERDVWIRIDSEWLLIWLDHTGRFKQYEIAND